MDHAIRIQEINSTPENIAPGESANIRIKIKNSANLYLDDVRIKLELPSQFKFLNDVNQVKISRLESGEVKDVGFNIISLPSSSEGIYEASLIIDYVSFLSKDHFNVGENKQDNYTFGLIVKAIPDIFAQIDSSEIYKGNDVGSITIRFVNRGVGDAKFLTVELLESKDYDIISADKEYVGDLDSDDFESVDFRIKLNKEKGVNLLLKTDYKDSLNKDYSQEVKLPFEVRDAKELGIKTNGTSTTIVIILIIAIAGYFIYKRYKKKKKIITIWFRSNKFKNNKKIYFRGWKPRTCSERFKMKNQDLNLSKGSEYTIKPYWRDIKVRAKYVGNYLGNKKSKSGSIHVFVFEENGEKRYAFMRENFIAEEDGTIAYTVNLSFPPRILTKDIPDPKAKVGTERSKLIKILNDLGEKL